MNVTVLKWLPCVDKTNHAIFCLNLKLHHAQKKTPSMIRDDIKKTNLYTERH